ncbi:hypothetical protein [Methanopyrus kandleri]|uniref:Uncharacterized protein specific for M.kandleri, MK-20 family n=1 Tax=Methanopyrus kandleri (strain AV19 / DSM 6324 / JCM 9639 / NBRC 100938) TaxID=190192 RepID=Q8TW50_METKA|nr:hypothetical protein [Methanopyrus kandleri]AAM02399.1 Uncharacterized protein specific for M.kandleri, MK-20 family [Methanopyrus kandleri AV19]
MSEAELVRELIEELRALRHEIYMLRMELERLRGEVEEVESEDDIPDLLRRAERAAEMAVGDIDLELESDEEGRWSLL